MPAKNSKPKSNKAAVSKRGGARAGAGRPTKETTKLKADFNDVTRAQLVEWLPRLLANMKVLADGGYERITDKFEPGPDGEPMLIERKVETAEPDRGANEYLINRLLGRPIQGVEHSGKDDKDLPSVVTIYLPDNHRGDDA